MKRALLVCTLLIVAWHFSAGCGFGIDDDLGTPTPAATYWGWQCADGTTPDPDAGCLPGDCDDNSDPTNVDGGDACVCADLSLVLSCACQDGGCGGGD